MAAHNCPERGHACICAMGMLVQLPGHHCIQETGDQYGLRLQTIL